MDTRRDAATVVFVGQFPPPISGLTYITSRLAEKLKFVGYDVAALSTTGASKSRSIGFHASRVLKVLFALFFLVVKAMLSRNRLCYVAADGGLGLIYTLMIVAIARLLRYRLFIHHHTYSYIVRPQPLMRLVLACSNATATHICLCSQMAQALCNAYGQVINTVVLSNAAFVPRREKIKLASSRQELVIGLLSNLTPAKGLYAFLEIIRIGKEQCLPVRGILAGPIIHACDKIFVDSLKDELSSSLEYRGPAYGAEKARFFDDIDVFVLPTTYLNEAQPTVIFEALANGIPVITYDRGCIRSQVGPAGYVFAPEVDIVSETLVVLRDYRDEPSRLKLHRVACHQQFENARRLAEAQISNLFDSRRGENAPPCLDLEGLSK